MPDKVLYQNVPGRIDIYPLAQMAEGLEAERDELRLICARE